MVTKQQNIQPKWSPSNDDVMQLKDNLKSYKQIRINGQLQRKFDQYCKSLGIITFDEGGYIVVLQEGDYERLNRINDKLEAIEWYDREAYMQTHPEERNKFVQMVKNFGNALRDKYAVKE